MQPYGIQSMLKEGHKHLSGLDEAVLKNIDACKQLSQITRTSLGPNGKHIIDIPLLSSLVLLEFRLFYYMRVTCIFFLYFLWL